MTDKGSYSKIPDWNDTLEECKMQAVKKRDAILKKVYRKLHSQIEKMDVIKSRIVSSMLNNESNFVYFSNKEYYKDVYTVFNLTGNEFDISCDEIKDIFTTTKYGEKNLFDLFSEKFPVPFRIGFDDDYHNIIIDWSTNNSSQKSEDSSCIII